MSEDWEEWDCDNYVIPVLNVPNKEQLKRLEERKLVEEADNALVDELFDNKKTPEIKQNIIKNNIEKPKKEKKISNQKENELKQKEFSQKLKKRKEDERKHSETFGDIIYDEYDVYDDKLF
jgi:hypothetical protein